MNRKAFIKNRRNPQSVITTVLLISILAAVSQSQESSITPSLVETKSGPIEGIILTNSHHQTVRTYYGIPYAEPPVGDLRFQPPKKVTSWSSSLKTNRPLPSCYQQIPKSLPLVKELRTLLQRPWSEDCLTLNVWAPDPKPEKAPVIAFIHGGGFVLGSSLWLFDGTNLALDGFVVVSMNYRLGAFGFFGLGIGEAPGNVGLMDQNLALHWIKDNIEAFGGDPESVTLAGMSAGSASVGYHLLSPKSKGLFKRAIMMSGAPNNIWGSQEPEKITKLSKSLIESVGCPSQNETLGLGCLKQKHPEDILEAATSSGDILENSFVPTVDGEFIVEHTSVSLSTGNFNPGEVLIGTAMDEGAEFMKSGNKKFFKTSDGRLPRKSFISVLKNVKKGLSELQIEALNVLYTDWSNPDDPLMLRDVAKDVYSDGWFNCHINEFADSLTKAGNPVYRYVFDYKVAFAKAITPAWMRAVHGHDQVLVFPPVQFIDHFGTSATDVAVTRRFFKHYTNFARHGDPNLSEDDFPGETTWPQYVFDHQYNLIRETSSIKSGHRSRQCAVWLNLLPLLEENNQC